MANAMQQAIGSSYGMPQLVVPYKNGDGTTRWLSEEENNKRLKENQKRIQATLYQIQKNNPLNQEHNTELDFLLESGLKMKPSISNRFNFQGINASNGYYSSDMTDMDKMLDLEEQRIKKSGFSSGDDFSFLGDLDDEIFSSEFTRSSSREEVEIIDDLNELGTLAIDEPTGYNPVVNAQELEQTQTSLEDVDTSNLGYSLEQLEEETKDVEVIDFEEYIRAKKEEEKKQDYQDILSDLEALEEETKDIKVIDLNEEISNSYKKENEDSYLDQLNLQDIGNQFKELPIEGSNHEMPTMDVSGTQVVDFQQLFGKNKVEEESSSVLNSDNQSVDEMPTMNISGTKVVDFQQLLKGRNLNKISYIDHDDSFSKSYEPLSLSEYRSRKTTVENPKVTSEKVTKRKDKSEKKSKTKKFSLKRIAVSVAMALGFTGLVTATKVSAPHFIHHQDSSITVDHENEDELFQNLFDSMNQIIADANDEYQIKVDNSTVNDETSVDSSSKTYVENTEDGVIVHLGNQSKNRNESVKSEYSSEADITDLSMGERNNYVSKVNHLIGGKHQLNDCKLTSTSTGAGPSVKSSILGYDNYKINRLAILSSDGKHILKTLKVDNKIESMEFCQFKDKYRKIYGNDCKFKIHVQGIEDGHIVGDIGWTSINHINRVNTDSKIYSKPRI